MSDVSFNARLSAANLSPLWEQFAALVPPHPKASALPAHWPYAQVRPLLLASAERISAEAAERRVLVLENPGLGRSARIADTLYAGLQIVLPGEVAPSHRHTQSALRFVVEGTGAWTTVAGERTSMERGDFVITPGWSWHEHANTGTDPVIWLDGLDVPIVASLGGAFFERGAEAVAPEAPARPDETDTRPGACRNRPIISFGYHKTRAALMAQAAHGAPDAADGYTVRYAGPGEAWALPTMAAQLRYLPRGFQTSPHRVTASRVLLVVEGRGVSRIGEAEIRWDENDVLVIPAWSAASHLASVDAVLFEFSDRAAQERLGLYREAR